MKPFMSAEMMYACAIFLAVVTLIIIIANAVGG
ncbi:hypothetical protein LCGC14_2788470 [marine sediment metagenome]|uniref:Uncharacterized protein n=1 Tax=marine sediment metagenome TaxID=412755 RepID=A0A0F9BHP1_9ZZZZ